MARFTQNDDEIRHLVKVQNSLPTFGILRVVLRNGDIVEGAIRGVSAGNNFESGMTAPTAFKGEYRIVSLDGTMHTLDVLDIESGVNVWDEQKQAYHDAGVITLVSGL